jgi:mannose-6-phosphate isomerase-like protein (cupin superfamily)
MAIINTTQFASTAASLAIVLAAGAGGMPAIAQQAAPPRSPARVHGPALAPGTPGIAVSGDQLAQQIKAALARSADPAVAEVAVTDQYAIHQAERLKPGPAAVHPGWTEVHLILEGGGTLVTGGKLTTGAGGGNTIEGGVSHPLKKGDVFIIPADTPHMYTQVDGTLIYFEVRFATAPPKSSAE